MSNSEPTLESLLHDLSAVEAVVADWDEQQQRTVAALRSSLDALHGEALRRLIRTLQEEPHSKMLLREAVNDEVVYAVLRQFGILRASLHERVEEALEQVRPMLANHGGNVELVGITEPDTVTLRLLGACDGCPASMITLTQGVEQAIHDHCPEITQIKTANPTSSAGAADTQVVRMVSPFEQENAWHDALAENALTENLMAIRVKERKLLIAPTRSGLRCFENACAHLGLQMEDGSVQDDKLVCPHHGFEYELDEGQCLTVPELCLQRIPVRIENGQVQVYLE